MELNLAKRPGYGPRCSYCRSDDGAALTPCPRCQLALHAECWGELEACPTIGCSATAAATLDPSIGGPGQVTCAACQSPTGGDDALVNCRACGLALHHGCWRDLALCPTPGCGLSGEEAVGDGAPANAAPRRAGHRTSRASKPANTRRYAPPRPPVTKRRPAPPVRARPRSTAP